jgi:hypothetical protein
MAAKKPNPTTPATEAASTPAPAAPELPAATPPVVPPAPETPPAAASTEPPPEVTPPTTTTAELPPEPAVERNDEADTGEPFGRTEALARLGLIEFQLGRADNLADVKAAVADLTALLRAVLTA